MYKTLKYHVRISSSEEIFLLIIYVLMIYVLHIDLVLLLFNAFNNTQNIAKFFRMILFQHNDHFRYFLSNNNDNYKLFFYLITR